jgi:hypothetical protein
MHAVFVMYITMRSEIVAHDELIARVRPIWPQSCHPPPPAQ